MLETNHVCVVTRIFYISLVIGNLLLHVVVTQDLVDYFQVSKYNRSRQECHTLLQNTRDIVMNINDLIKLVKRPYYSKDFVP